MTAKGTSSNTAPGAAEPKKRRGRPPRPVICLETGAVYASAKDAAKLCKIGRPVNIARAIRNNTTSGGFHWSYAQDLQPDTLLLEANTAPSKRAVVCWETGKVFPSAKDAARSVGLEETCRVTTAIACRATAGGFHWYWADEPKPKASQLTKPSTTGKRPVVCYETGEVFENYIAAAQAVGLERTYAITRAIKTKRRAGGYHWYFQDQPIPESSEPKTAIRRPVVCWETGQVFPSTREAALSIGAEYPSSISTAIARRATAGGLHWYYADQPKPSKAELTDLDAWRKGRAVVCYETGVEYESATDAARELGLKSGPSVTRAIREKQAVGGYHWYYADQPRPDESTFKGGRGRPGIPVVCVENGEVFPSAAAAAKVAGLKNSALILAAAKGNGCAGGLHWRFVEDGKPGADGQGAPSARGRTRPVVCYETGEEFESVKAAAHAVGFEASTAIVAAIKRGGMCGGFHWFYKGDAKPDASQLRNPKDRCAKPVVCKETGRSYPSAAAAAEAIGLKSAAVIYTAIRKKTKSGGYHWDWETR